MSVTINGTTGISKTQPSSAPWLTGMIIAFGNETAPDGWLTCDGSAVSRTTYDELFAKVGTKWGVGDGSTTFNLPDMRETVAIGTGTRGSGVTAHDTYTVGQFKDDQEQGHDHFIFNSTDSNTPLVTNPDRTPSHLYNISTSFDMQVGAQNANPANAGKTNAGLQPDISGNGTPRTGTTTHGKQAGVLYCIKT